MASLETSPAAGSAGHWVDRFRSEAAGLPGARLPWLLERRQAAIQRFAEQGFPTRKVEAWRYTDLRDVARLPFAAPPAAAVGIDRLPSVLDDASRGPRLVFVDGAFRAELSSAGSLPEGVTVASLAAALETMPDRLEPHLGRVRPSPDTPLAALNAALWTDGAFVHLARGAALDRPIELLFLGVGGEAPAAHHPRILIVAEAGAEATVIEHHAGLGGVYFSNAAVEIVAEAGARLHHYKLQAEGAEAFHVATTTLAMDRDAAYDGFVLTQGARLSRSELRPWLGAPGIECRLSGAYMVAGRQHADHTSVIDHAAPHCTSRQVYHGVIDDQARAVFQGRINVHQDAQKTDGYQLNRALLLSDQAEIDSKPELEIFADDVRCSHGATVGDLDEEQIFYLRARGIDRAAARSLLIAGFLMQAVEEIRIEAVRDGFAEKVRGWLDARAAGERRNA
ncbi:Fe-S cluster assembly protein SufD [Arenibaculum pallidiluteum]|uniref:Fe-S cluster assembly protein SufD n=1 Tax=Arenibaculum pallidiluteum TaxID=2812559 RepID=UPI001A971CB6|nr:Fe-S cluster assembly protein SufD [Arenibaculum pallidiluteum]